MSYLILSIIFMSWWALSYKIAFRRKCYPLGVMLTTYGVAALLALLWSLLTSPSYNSLSMFIGAIAGIGVFTAVITYFSVIGSGARLGVSWTIITLSMIIPTSFSIFLWKEIPTFSQTLGLLFAIVGIYLLGQVKGGSARLTGKEWGMLSISFFMTGGVALSTKLITVLGLEKSKSIYLLFVNGSAFTLTLAISWAKKRLPNLEEMKVGVGMGTAGIVNIFFLLLALETLPGTLAFPLRTCGNILLTIFITYLIWREKINRNETIGLSLSLLAIVFMNL